MSIKIIHWGNALAEERAAVLARPALSSSQEMRHTVQEIVQQVRTRGDDAVRELTKRLDNVSLATLKVSPEEFEAAEELLTADQKAAIELAIANVRCFHEAQLPAPLSVETMPGIRCERISHAIDAVGLYVPAGTAPLPSAAIMLAVPAAIAGCTTRVLCTPPATDGRADAAVLVASKRAGVTDIFKVGGAQAIAAMAFGTESVPEVDKIFGPGSAWVTEAKNQVASDPQGAAIDMPAGPSEVLVIADGNANAEFVASDLLSQAEHGPDSQVLLLTTSLPFADRVRKEIDVQLASLSRASIARQSISNSVIVVTDDLETAIDLSNSYAPEHLILQLDEPRDVLPSLRNAGSIFIGKWSPESAGDYCSGTNHVLPTYGYARSFSGLSVEQFMRNMTVQELSRDGLRSIGKAIIDLAGLEGLDAHAAAVERRLAATEDGQ